MATPTTTKMLTDMGFEDVKNFQRAWARTKAVGLYRPLTIDGVAGAKTRRALTRSYGYWTKGQPNLSTHFSSRELACKCCGKVRVSRALLRQLEKLRKIEGPLNITSGYRCTKHNKAVGGATNSQHLYGRAVDLAASCRPTVAVARSLFNGVGIHSSGRVLHVDVRPGAHAEWHY